jgi:hypothetical protein
MLTPIRHNAAASLATRAQENADDAGDAPLSLPFPVMTCLPGLSRFLTKPQLLMRAHAPIARERARDLYVFAQGFWSQTCWRHTLGAPAVGPRI